MKVIENKNKPDTEFPIKIECEHCGSVLEVDEEDLIHGHLGCACVVCPACGQKTYDGLEDFDMNLTLDTLKFPEHYWDIQNAVTIDDEEINKEVKRCVWTLRHEPECFCTSYEHGDLYICVFNYSGDKEYHIVVANKNGWYSTALPFDAVDEKAQDSIDWRWYNKPTYNTGVMDRK